MRIVLLGAPGSGKGTQGSALSRRLNVPHVSSGDLLRDNMRQRTELGVLVDGYVRRGELVPDDLILRVVWDAATAAVAQGGFILDGFPRTLPQAERAYELAMPAGITADRVLHLVVPDQAVRERLAARAVEGRPDDASTDVVERRIELYHQDTEPLLEFYRQREILVDIDAARPVDEVTLTILDALGSPASPPS